LIYSSDCGRWPRSAPLPRKGRALPGDPRPSSTAHRLQQPDPMSLADLIRHAAERPLTVEEAEAAFDDLMQGVASPVQIAALLTAIKVRGAVPDEVAGGV